MVDGITEATNLILSRLQEITEDRTAWKTMNFQDCSCPVVSESKRLTVRMKEVVGRYEREVIIHAIYGRQLASATYILVD
ncbi:hypothetical protein M513_06201 [Trichuris suis]|uniref:Uncharacterized protein n=1 Tax=Trichuris suis TaxID=68888 RepID=A0A085M6P5_9BILA|nr:hypothetical protein M513_06201 [Trichuris suis]